MTPIRKPTPPRDRNSGTFLALFALVLAGGGLVGLTALVLPSLVVFPLLLFALFCVGVFHYVVWGWWLGTSRRAEEIDER